jgi:hypothetical protein
MAGKKRIACKSGFHLLTEETTFAYPSDKGRRRCKACYWNARALRDNRSKVKPAKAGLSDEQQEKPIFVRRNLTKQTLYGLFC